MAATEASVRAAVLEQTERTRRRSNTEIERIIKESELETISLKSRINTPIESRGSHRATTLAPEYTVVTIHILPVELLAEILDLAIEDDTHIKDVYRVSQVCSDWRQVAHSTPRLWTRPLQVNLRRKGNMVDGLKTWLMRSAPMSIDMTFSSGFTNINPDVLEEVLNVAPRWRSLRTHHMNTTLPVWFTSQLSQCRLDSLEVLELGRIDDDTEPTPLCFTVVPRLRTFSICSLLPAPQIQTLIPWVQLTDLTVTGGHSTDGILDTLAWCPNLLRVSVTIPGWRQLFEAKRDTILVLPQLHTLLFYFPFSPGEQMHHITPFFDQLSTPLLQALHMLVRGSYYWTQAHFSAFQLRAPNITWLEFRYSYSFTSNNMIAVIRNAVSLTHLRIVSCNRCFDDAFISTLYYQDGVAPLVPGLHDLIVRGHFEGFTEDHLAGMIASRWWPDTELASHSVLRAVARWTQLQLEFERHTLSQRFTEILKDMPSDVLKIRNPKPGSVLL
ncbi:hypothetical protein C8R45DRAFT_1223788 [Mycena sanguinolenta]|nr:hypothetical protein C8R45DRAFT_1223788 [Mycena sanguinolenta]